MNADKQGQLLEYVRKGKPIDYTPIIDIHTHLGNSTEFYYIPQNNIQVTLKNMDEIGINHLISFAATCSTDPRPANDYHYRISQQYPEKVSVLSMLHAQFSDDWIPLLKEGHKQGSRGIKLIADYQRVRNDQVDWSPAFEYAKGKNWIVLNHSWGTPALLAEYANNFPDVYFIIGHSWGGYEKVVKKFDNVYMCTCAFFTSAPFAGIEQLWNTLPIEKILHGSDSQDLDFCTAIGPIAYNRIIPEADKEKILGLNALKLIKKLTWDINLA